LRWGTLDLTELRGVQSVLGPTILVGPEAVAIACGLAFAGGLIGLGAWLLEPRPHGRGEFLWSAIEVGLGSLALVTIFIDPARSVLQGAGFGLVIVELARWLGTVAIAALVVWGASILQSRLSERLRWIVLAAAAAAVGTAAGLVAVTL
jgi:hypothetical protein